MSSIDIEDVSRSVADEISYHRKFRDRGYVAYSVKRQSEKISLLLGENHYTISDLFRCVSDRLGAEPCNHRNFRTLCDRYCYPGSTQQNNPRKKSDEPNRKGEAAGKAEVEAVEKDERKEAPKENSSKKADDLKLGDDVQSPGDEWDEIFEALGPLKKIELWRAIERGLTLKIAKEAHQNGLRKLQEKLSEFAERKF